MSYSATVLADSITSRGERLTTFAACYPRLIHSELMTHRAFSRNTASSRAIPVAEMLRRARQEPFVPTYWGITQRGMQATAELTGKDRDSAIAAWLLARDQAIQQVEALLNLRVHKQLANRLLEPFLWHTAIITATDWSNFFALRANPMAQPEIRRIAELLQDTYHVSRPKLVTEGDWHLPLLQPDEYDGSFELSERARRVSAARCARVSYLTHDGQRDVERDLELYERLVSEGHLSPLEHVATPRAGRHGNLKGWMQLRKFYPNEDDFSKFGGAMHQ